MPPNTLKIKANVVKRQQDVGVQFNVFLRTHFGNFLRSLFYLLLHFRYKQLFDVMMFQMFVMLSALAFLSAVENDITDEDVVCDPSRNNLRYSASNERCNDCNCSKNGKVLVCKEISCTKRDEFDKWGLEDHRVVKMCSPGVAVFVGCNICVCTKDYQPKICTLMKCELNKLLELKLDHPEYPLF